MEDENPYRAPEIVAAAMLRRTPRAGLKLGLLCVGWTLIFLINLPEPLSMLSEGVYEHGAAGMFVAAAVLFLLGGAVCTAQRNLGLTLVFGGVPVGLSQVFPILQFMAELIAIGIGEAMGVVEYIGEVGHRDMVWRAASELGGFAVTFLTGGLLMGAAIAFGLAIRAVLPGRNSR